MINIKYKLKLVSDANPSSGFGTEFIDSLITRNIKGKPIIRASHIKGLMRQTINDVFSVLGKIENPLIDIVFGSGDDSNTTAVFSLTDIELLGDEKPFILSKTKINNFGVAEKGSLRSSEFISTGSEFEGNCYINVERNSVEDLAVRFALLSLDAIGGSRTRGAGTCIVSIAKEERTPGALLHKLYKLLNEVTAEGVFDATTETPDPLSDAVRLFKIQFKADTPVCCPEIPVKTNQIDSGFSIPASAVQGAILNRLNSVNPSIASGCFKSNYFRTWPLQPISEKAISSVRVSLTHMVDKNAKPFVANPNKFWFTDKAIHEDWRDRAKGGSLKSSDGVLLTTDSEVVLWKDSAIPRVVSIHNKVNSTSRGLFSLESIAPITWSGYLAIPEEAAKVLLESISDNSFFSFGKKRSSQGGGKLSLTAIENFGDSLLDKTILVTQSPILIDYTKSKSLDEQFHEFVNKWATENNLPMPSKVWADAGIRFGWNRHNIGKTVGEHSRLQAVPIVLPGAVIKFDSVVEKNLLKKALIAGLGEGKQRGFGAVLLHPGVANRIEKPPRELKKMPAIGKEALMKAIKLVNAKEALPSASQTGSLLAKYKEGGNELAINFLRDMKNKRGIKYYSDWTTSYNALLDILKTEYAELALNYLINISIARRKEDA